jgi:hypothetical protein
MRRADFVEIPRDPAKRWARQKPIHDVKQRMKG